MQVEVRIREGRTINIHMLCAGMPGLLLSTMRALDGLGLDVQQAVISCFNGFALDVFRAEVHSYFKLILLSVISVVFDISSLPLHVSCPYSHSQVWRTQRVLNVNLYKLETLTIRV